MMYANHRAVTRHLCVSAPKECACVITNSSAKQCDWLSHARPAPIPFPLFLFPDANPLLIVEAMYSTFTGQSVYYSIYSGG